VNGMRRLLVSLGPAQVVLTTALPVEQVAEAMRSRGEPFLFGLTPARDCVPGAAQVVHVEAAPGDPAATWDRSTLTVRAATGELLGEGLLYLAYLVLESELHRHGYLTLHAASACRGRSAVLLLGPAGAGKTTTLLRLCRDHGAALVGNDLVVVGGSAAVPEVLAGSRHLRLRHASIAQAIPELLGLFTGDVSDSWRAKQDIDPVRLGIDAATGPVPVAAAVFVHVDMRSPHLVDEPGDTLVHRLNLHENALRYVRGASTPWLLGDGRFGPYVPPLDDERAHAARVRTLERLLARSRYVAGPPAAVAQHLSGLLAAGSLDQKTAGMRRTP
jgi:hypothetical protein